MAVPMMVKMPEPMTAPIPSDVRLSHPRDFFNRTSAFSESDSSWSILLQRKSCDPTHALRSHPGKPENRSYPNAIGRSEEHTSELQSRRDLVCRLLLEKKKKKKNGNLHTQIKHKKK